MSPFVNQLHVDALLSNVSVRYEQAELIGMKVFPIVPVKKESDLFRIYDRNMRIPESQRADGAVAKQDDFEVSNASYLLVRHSLREIVTDNQAKNYDLADLRVDTTEHLTGRILNRLELDVANLFTTTNWSLNVSLAATAAWNANTTVSDPVPIVMTGATEVIENSGFKPNFGILPRSGYVAVKNHTSVLDRLKYTTAEVDEKKIAAMFDLQELLIANAAYDTADRGVTASFSNFYGDNMFLGYKPATAGPKRPSSGYIFKSEVPMVKRYRDEAREGEWIEVSMMYQARVVASLSGFLIRDILA